MFFQKYLKKIVFIGIITFLFVVFALFNSESVKITLFGFKDKFAVWELVLYSMILSSITTFLFFVPSVISLKSKYKALNEKFERLSEAKLKDAINCDEEIIE